MTTPTPLPNPETRAGQEEMKRMGISADEARYTLTKDDDERRRWSIYLYGKDTHDPSLYDLLIHIRNITVEEAVEIILQTAALPAFQTTEASQETLNDLALSAQIEALLIKEFPYTEAFSKRGKVHVTVRAPLSLRKKLGSKIKHMVKRVDGVKEVEVSIIPLHQ